MSNLPHKLPQRAKTPIAAGKRRIEDVDFANRSQININVTPDGGHGSSQISVKVDKVDNIIRKKSKNRLRSDDKLSQLQ